jgi:hypothetical protein
MPKKEARPRMRRPEAIPFIIAFIFWLAIVVRYFMPGLKITTVSFDTWVNLGYLVILVCLVVAAIIRFTLVDGIETPPPEEACAVEAEVVEGRPAKQAGKPAGAAPRPKQRAAKAASKQGKAAAKAPAGVTVTTVAEEEPVGMGAGAEPPVAAPAPPEPEESIRLIEYPKKQLGEVYHDSFIRIEEGLVLNLRTKLGRVCGNCEELPECRKRVEGRLPDDVFEVNFECKEGLKRELSRAKLAKEPAEALKAAAAAAKAAEATARAEPAAIPVTAIASAPITATAVAATAQPTAPAAAPAPPPAAPEPTPSPSPSPPAPEAPREPEVFKGEAMASYGTTDQDEELEVGEDDEEAATASAPEPGHEQSIRTKKKKVMKKRSSPDAADPSVDTLPPEGG